MNELVQFTSGDVSYSVPAMLPPGTWAKNGAILHGVAHLKRRGFFLGYVGDWRSPAGIQEKSDIKWVDQIDKDRPAEPERVRAPNAPDYVPGGKSVFPNGPGTAWLQHGDSEDPRVNLLRLSAPEAAKRGEYALASSMIDGAAALTELAETKRQIARASALPDAWRSDAEALLTEFRPMAAVKMTCAEELREALK